MLRVSFLLTAVIVTVNSLNLNIPQQLKIGDSIELEIQLTNQIQRFSLNLASEFDKFGAIYNINYHHRFDVAENRVLLDSFVDGVWQMNSKIILHPNPVKKGDRFRIIMYLGQEGIHTSVKNQLSFYPHKIPLNKIKWVTLIEDQSDNPGNFDVKKISFNYA